jgi:glycosyltransferase involved in cell wall biosynthesis
MLPTFVIPANEAIVSGGNIYNNKLITSLMEITSVERITWHTFSASRHTNTQYIFDSLYLDFFEKEQVVIPPRSILLLHYLDVFYEQRHNQPLILKKIKLLNSFDHIIVTGKFTHEWLLNHGVPSSKIVLIEPCIENGIRNTTVISGKKRILMIGNLVPVKGYTEILEELDVQKPTDVTLTVLGDDSIDKDYSSRIFNKVKSSAFLSSIVQVAGTVPHEEVHQFFAKSNLFLSASHFETFGMAVHEALHYGLAVYAIGNGNLSRIVHPLFRQFSDYPSLISAVQIFDTSQNIVLPSDSIKQHTYSWRDAAITFQACLIN